MNEEIKEIKLDHFKDLEELKQNVETWIKEDEMYWNRWFGLSDLSNLLDYITNLQKENEELKQDNIIGCEKFIKQSQRINKAIEYIKKEDELYYIKVFCRDLLKILGGDE